jgi:D-alanyl-lipoteichoic acid acyltransferase DltB (MBOAT superfamily)
MGGNRNGQIRKYVNILITMIIGGIWHGAGLTFVLWGALHGLYLIINHFWNKVFPRERTHKSLLLKIFNTTLTFLCITWAWVPFRSANTEVTYAIWFGLLGFNGLESNLNISDYKHILQIIVGLSIVWLLPNLNQYNTKSVIEDQKMNFTFLKFDLKTAILVGLLFFTSILSLNSTSEFLYFQF